MRNTRWLDWDESLTMSEIVLGGLGEVLSDRGAFHLVTVHLEEGQDVVYALEKRQFRSWQEKRRVRTPPAPIKA